MVVSGISRQRHRRQRHHAVVVHVSVMIIAAVVMSRLNRRLGSSPRERSFVNLKPNLVPPFASVSRPRKIQFNEQHANNLKHCDCYYTALLRHSDRCFYYYYYYTTTTNYYYYYY